MQLPTKDKESIKIVCQYLFDIWKEAKESSEDEWDIEYDALPEKHKHEYELTAGRLLMALENLGYHKGLPSSIEEALNSVDGTYRP